MIDPPPCPNAILSLVKRFEYYRPSYLREQYNEKHLCRKFIDSCFRTLRWGVDNRKGLSRAY